MSKSFWSHDKKPLARGWHPVLVCYEVNEGAFPHAAFWDGVSWSQRAVIAFGDKQDTEESAKNLAYEHDPEI